MYLSRTDSGVKNESFLLHTFLFIFDYRFSHVASLDSIVLTHKYPIALLASFMCRTDEKPIMESYVHAHEILALRCVRKWIPPVIVTQRKDATDASLEERRKKEGKFEILMLSRQTPWWYIKLARAETDRRPSGRRRRWGNKKYWFKTS